MEKKDRENRTRIKNGKKAYEMANRIVSLIMCFALTVLLAAPVKVWDEAFAEDDGQNAGRGVSAAYSSSSQETESQSKETQSLTDDDVVSAPGVGTVSETDELSDPADTTKQPEAADDPTLTEENQQLQQDQPADQLTDQSEDVTYAGNSADGISDKGVDVLNPEDVVTEETGAASVGDSASAAKAAKKTKKKAKRRYVHKKTVVIDGRTFSFNQKVAKNKRLKVSKTPRNFYVKGYRSKIKLKWNAPLNTAITGYFVMRYSAEAGKWVQIAKLDANQTSYKDLTAKVPDTSYIYIVLSYRKAGADMVVSHTTEWAGAVTTRSEKNNVYSVTVKNPARVSAVSIGKTAKIKLKYPKKAYNKALRWSSSDPSIATVSPTGIITGVGKGSVTIYGKMHTGNTLTATVNVVEPGTAEAMVTVMASWMDYSTLNGKHEGIIDIYNEQDPLPVSYAMSYSDAWCDATVTAAAIVSGNYDLIGGECSVPRHITIFKNKKIWKEDGTITPKKGDLIIYSWHKYTQPNNASASHIGIVESVKNGQITTIEGNMGSGVVGRRVINVGYGCIRGFARPKYAKSVYSNTGETVNPAANPSVITAKKK